MQYRFNCLQLNRLFSKRSFGPFLTPLVTLPPHPPPPKKKPKNKQKKAFLVCIIAKISHSYADIHDGGLWEIWYLQKVGKWPWLWQILWVTVFWKKNCFWLFFSFAALLCITTLFFFIQKKSGSLIQKANIFASWQICKQSAASQLRRLRRMQQMFRCGNLHVSFSSTCQKTKTSFLKIHSELWVSTENPRSGKAEPPQPAHVTTCC